jgi:hypothetical protein
MNYRRPARLVETAAGIPTGGHRRAKIILTKRLATTALATGDKDEGNRYRVRLKLRSASRLLPLAGILLLALSITTMPLRAADLGPTASEESAPATLPLREALSRYLSLEMIRATFEVIPRDDLEAALEEQAVRWSIAAPSAASLADLDQQLLTEASYYLVSLSYLVQVGGAVFPGDRAEMVYANDTISKLDDLRRQLVDAVESGGDVLPVLVEVERIRALTEGYSSVPEDFGVFTDHDALLDQVLSKLDIGTPT